MGRRRQHSNIGRTGRKTLAPQGPPRGPILRTGIVMFMLKENTNERLGLGRMRLAIGADHAGYDLKSQVVPWLEASGHDVVDLGAHFVDPQDDYPDFAAAVARSLTAGEAERGVVICGSGVGASITANKVKGIRASVCHDTFTARQGVEHDAMNVICVGGRVIGLELAKAVLGAFLDASFVPESRFQRRLDKLNEVERRGA